MQVGSGGACDRVAGVEVWTMGRPNRPYEIIGVIQDRRAGGVIPMAMRDGSVARKARAKGGDGIIVLSENKEYLGTLNTMSATSNLYAQTHLDATTSFTGPYAYTRGTAYTTGTMSTFGTGMSVPITKAHGSYQVFRYVRGGGTAGAVPTVSVPVQTGRVRQDGRGTTYLE